MDRELNIKKFVSNNWHLLILLVIFLTAFWLRSFPARFGELQALDPFYFYRASEHVLENNWELFDKDILRTYPDGNNPWKTEYLGPIYMPAFVYALGGGWNMEYLHFAILWPAVLGALTIIPAYFLGKELFGKTAGFFAAFFLATTPAFIARSSAGFFEKEPLAGLFILLGAFFFVKSFKTNSWPSGILGGVSTFIAAISWGGMRYMFLLYGTFLGIILLAYTALVVMDYLFSGGFRKTLEKVEGFLGMEMVKAFGLTVILGYILSSFFYVNPAPIHSLYIIFPFMVWGILLLRNLFHKAGFLTNENVRHFIPGMLLLLLVSVAVGSIFSDYVGSETNRLINIITFNRGVTGSTVAENAPGSWGSIASVTGAVYARSFPVTGQLFDTFSVYVSLWLFMFLGMGLIIYRLYRTRDMLLFLPLAWILISFWGVFYYVRLTFLLGPPAALLGGFFASWLVTRKSRIGISNRIRRIKIGARESINGMAMILTAIVALLLIVNFTNAFVYSINLGPSICFPRYSEENPLEVEPCVTIDEDGSLNLAENQPWYDSLEFMRDYANDGNNNIEYPPVVLTWWDFGYWFQSRGGIASVADGGVSGDREEIAHWFTSDTSEWGEWEDWLEYHKVDYILMDYTLPGKYGAISKIASGGKQIVGFLEFKNTGMYPKDNQTTYIFANGPYEIWIPFDDKGTLAGTPMFLIKQNNQYVQRTYINDVCTKDFGIIKTGENTPSLGGCVALSDLGVFYVPSEAENNVFTSLMFMEGAGLPVEKIYDSDIIIIYKLVSGQ